MSQNTLYTVGHSNLDLDEFLTLLRTSGIETLVDIRAYPHSRRFPHFERDALRSALVDAGLVYHWAGRSLGGHRKPKPDSPHHALQDDAMRGYADHMESDVFQTGVGQLQRLAADSRLVLMCAERQPEHCHRYLLADYLVLNGCSVWHIISAVERREHLLSATARRESRSLVYDRFARGVLDLRH